MKWLRNSFAAYGIVLACVIAYWQAPSLGMHYDDAANVTQYEPVAAGDVWQSLLHPRDPLRCVSFATFALDTKLAHRLDVDVAEVAHVTSVVLHCLTALAVLWLLVLLTRSVMASGLAALVWAVHPIHTTAVAYVTQRMAVLGALGAVLTVCCWLMWRRSGSKWWLLVGANAFMFGALSKPTGLLAVPLVCLVDAIVVGGWPRRRVWTALLLTAAAVLYTTTQTQPVMLRWEFTAWERVLAQPGVIVHQASQLVLPLPSRLAVWHEVEPGVTWWLVPGLMLCGAWGVLVWRTRGLVRLGLAWPAVAMLLEYGPALIDMEYEYRLYLPSVGLALLLAICLRGRHE